MKIYNILVEIINNGYVQLLDYFSVQMNILRIKNN